MPPTAALLGLARRPPPGCRHDKLFLSYQGLALRSGINTISRRFFYDDAKRVGIQNGTERPNERIIAHCMRHFFSNELKRNGIDPYWWNILRGDVPKGNENTYLHPTFEQIQAQYLQHAPTFRIQI